MLAPNVRGACWWDICWHSLCTKVMLVNHAGWACGLSICWRVQHASIGAHMLPTEPPELRGQLEQAH